MKVLFLDIDGVANCESTAQRWDGNDNYLPSVGDTRGGFLGADPTKVSLVNAIVQVTGCQVVLSSTWRKSKTWRDTMKKLGFNFEFFDRTGGSDTGHRGFEIQEWIDNRGVMHPEDPVTKYAILDDDSDMLDRQMPSFFHTSFRYGLTPEIAVAVENWLKME